jgi:hypothetical protein
MKPPSPSTVRASPTSTAPSPSNARRPPAPPAPRQPCPDAFAVYSLRVTATPACREPMSHARVGAAQRALARGRDRNKTRGIEHETHCCNSRYGTRQRQAGTPELGARETAHDRAAVVDGHARRSVEAHARGIPASASMSVTLWNNRIRNVLVKPGDEIVLKVHRVAQKC